LPSATYQACFPEQAPFARLPLDLASARF